MKAKSILFCIYLLILAPIVQAQVLGVQNGDLEIWRRREFRCCGRNVDLPFSWGIPEQSCGINFNKFVFLEEDSFNIHSGLCSARLYSDTSFFNNIGLQPGMLIYGGYPNPYDSTVTLGLAVADSNSGMPVDSNPAGLTFWAKMSHNATDTFSYTYFFSHWDSATQTRDTLAYATTDIPDSQVPMDQWFSVSKNILYRHAGKADTARLFFYSGRFGNAALQGNITWMDDIGFYYKDSEATTTGVVPIPVRDSYTIYPNPATDKLHIMSGSDVQGDIMELSDELGRIVSETTMASAVSSADISRLAPGTYICRLLGTDHSSLYQGKVTIVR